MNIEHYGPGIWSILHFYGKRSKTLSDVKMYSNIVKDIIEKIPCQKCKNHAKKYFHINKIVDPFHWSLHFHNKVNKHLNKKQMKYIDAENLIHKNIAVEFKKKQSGIWPALFATADTINYEKKIYLVNNFIKMIFLTQNQDLIKIYFKLSEENMLQKTWKDPKSLIIYFLRFYNEIFEEKIVPEKINDSFYSSCKNCSINH